MTGQTKDWAEYKKADGSEGDLGKHPGKVNATDDQRSTDSVDPSTREILHMLQMMEGKSSA